ncbi:hypothetical protein HPB50_027845 [Hyalomma asiaticum]|nr:hypothetical protein HPB50_027845 [Hyalomma asiaticum]
MDRYPTIFPHRMYAERGPSVKADDSSTCAVPCSSAALPTSSGSPERLEIMGAEPQHEKEWDHKYAIGPVSEAAVLYKARVEMLLTTCRELQEKNDKLQKENSHLAAKTEASGDSQEKGDGAAVLAASIKAPDAREEDAKRENIVQATTEACAGGPAKEGLDMECEESATPAVGKRQLEVSEENGKPEAFAGEPLPKAQFTRRPTLKIQPKVPPDRRATPSAAKTMPADPP